MNLSIKIFITFFISVTVLLCTTLYLIDTRTEQHTIDYLIKDLNKTQTKFQLDLDTRQKHIQTLGRIITTDQKFRSFLSQIKDNFYPFTAEIGQDTKADFVFMLDDEPVIRATYSVSEHNSLPLSDNFLAFKIQQRIDSTQIESEMISLSDNLYSSHFIPLKENLMDDYAVGLIVISNQINDRWIDNFLISGENLKAVFYNNLQVVAKNTSEEFALGILKYQQSASDANMFMWNQQRYILKQVLFNKDDPNAGYILSINLDQLLLELKKLQQQILVIGGSILLLGAILFFLISLQITRPLRLITKGTLAINRGEFKHRINYKSKDEVGQLATAFNVMASGLEEKERIRDTFNQYVDPVIVTELLDPSKQLKLGGERKEQTVLFSDIADFTSFSEKLPAEALVKLLNEYFTLMTDEISQQKGILDKFIGDAVMAYWSPLICNNQHAQQACQTALNMQKILDNFRPVWLSRNQPEINVRIGIATGEMIVGNIGSEQARRYTCIGDKVNYSSRLEGLNKHYGTQIIIDQQTCSQISGLVVRELDWVRVKGREKGEAIFELVGVTDQLNPEKIELINQYQQGLDFYRKAQFSEAEKIFSSLENDLPGQVMVERCKKLQKQPMEPWDGIHTMLNK